MSMFEWLKRKQEKEDRTENSPVQCLHGNETGQQWRQLVNQDYGFAISYPPGWAVHSSTIGVPAREFLLVQADVPSVYDSMLRREVYNPFVNVVITEWSNASDNIVGTFAQRRPGGYEKYKLSKIFQHDVTGASHVMAYEFGFGRGANSFNVISLLVQMKARLFIITAQNKADGFEVLRDTLQRIVFSFNLLPS